MAMTKKERYQGSGTAQLPRISSGYRDTVLTDQKDKTVPYDYPTLKGDAQPGSIRNSQEQVSTCISCGGPLAEPQSSEDSGRIDGRSWFKRRK